MRYLATIFALCITGLVFAQGFGGVSGVGGKAGFGGGASGGGGATSNCGQTSQTGTDSNNGQIAIATPCASGANANGYSVGTIFYWVGSPASAVFDLGVYSNVAGAPNSLLCHSNTGTITPSAGWNSIAITGCGTVAANTTIWIGYITSINPIQQGYVTGSNCGGTGAITAFDGGGDIGLPATFSVAGSSNCYSFYAVLTAL